MRLKFALTLLFLAGCGNDSLTTQQTGCSGTGALILVNDLYLQSLCGCQEGNGTLAGPGTTLTCTLSGSGSVVFHFSGTNRQQHQIVPDGNSTILTSPLILANKNNRASQHAFQISTSGTYAFFDAHVPALRGRIIVP